MLKVGDKVRSKEGMEPSIKGGYVGKVLKLNSVGRPDQRKVEIKLLTLPDGYDVSDRDFKLHSFEDRFEVIE